MEQRDKQGQGRHQDSRWGRQKGESREVGNVFGVMSTLIYFAHLKPLFLLNPRVSTSTPAHPLVTPLNKAYTTALQTSVLHSAVN